MAERVYLVHGWSVESTLTYRGLDRALAAQGYELADIFLGRYVSLDDHVTIPDLATGLERALADSAPPAGERYHFITHSTGALVVRDWLRRLYRPRGTQARVGGIVMLAGPQFGSRLAHLGRSVLAKLKWFGDTGDGVLHGLELGSPLQWHLADDLLNHGPVRGAKGKPGEARIFAITGDSFDDNKLSARIVAASAETGSDGTVRTAAANPNLARLDVRLVPVFHRDNRAETERVTWHAEPGDLRVSEAAPFLVLPDYYHTDDRKNNNRGILRSIRGDDTPESNGVLAAIVECLGVTSDTAYAALERDFRQRTEPHFRPDGWKHMSRDEKRADRERHTPRGGPEAKRNRPCFSQLQFRFRTDAGEPVRDYRFEMTCLKNGQRRATRTITHVHPNTRSPEIITFFLGHDELEPDLTYDFTLAVRHRTPLLHDVEATFSMTGTQLQRFVARHRTTQIDVVVESAPRLAVGPQDAGLFGFTPADDASRHFEFDRRGRAERLGLDEDHGLKS